MSIRLLSLVSLLLLSLTTYAQRTCGSMEVLDRQVKENPARHQKLQEINDHAAEYAKSNPVSDRAVITIPVVVHVVYRTAVQNISDAQILSQIAVLNADFRRLNADAVNTPSAFQGIAADAEVEFCLAQQTPSGAATNGILRVSTTKTSFNTNDAVKFTAQGGSDAWDASKYLNIWVCNLGTSLLGYAQFPGGPAATDGVVIHYKYFGTTGTATAPFNLGRTATHEVGHWLNLYHIWGDDGSSCTLGSDNVADTPNQADENYGCPAFPAISCSNGPNGDMFMNYMDYTDDACMNVFSAGQKSRMQALFATNGARVSLLTSPGCNPPSTSCGTPTGLGATTTQTTAALSWATVSGATSYTLQWKLASSSTWTTVNNISTNSYNLSGLTAGTSYNFQVRAVCGSTTGAYSSAFTFATQPASGCSDIYEPNNSRSKSLPLTQTGVDLQALIGTSSDVDYFRFSVPSSAKNIKIDLTNVPFDYDLKLWRGNAQLAVSQNGGTASEQIIRNNNTVASNYYAHVYGYNGAFSASQCYTLRITLSSTAFRLDGNTDGDTETFEVPLTSENAFGLFPNPATQEVTVEIPMTEETDVRVLMLDGTGKLLLEQSQHLGKSENRITFDLSNIPTGVYFVQVRNGEQVATRKLVVQK